MLERNKLVNNDLEDIDPWTDYWRTGAEVSCIANPAMESRLTRIWEEYVDGLSSNSRILDLATGNGVVAVNCASRARVRKIHLDIDAIDAADINPTGCLADPRQLLRHVSFRGGIQLESLPFDEREFSGVVSQFGFEYADEEQAVSEVSRVMADGGKLRLIIHAENGAVSKDIGQRLERLDATLEKNGPVSLVLALVQALEAGDNETIQRKSNHLDAATELTRNLATDPLPNDSALFYATEFMNLWSQRERYWPADMLRSAEQGWISARGTATRQAQMLGAARSTDDIDALRRRFESSGVNITGVKRILDQQRDTQNAWLVDGTKLN